MDCEGIRESAYEYLKGWCDPEQTRTIGSHLSACTPCQAELRQTRSTLSLLQTLPEIDLSPETWNNIEARLAAPRARRNWVPLAAAASILTAFITLMAMPRTGVLPVVAETGRTLKWNESFRAEAVATLHLSGAGTLKLNRNATLRFLDPRTVLLESGELFADIQPSGRGFEIRTADTRVQVRGTRFGVHAPSTVYVVEGRVEVTSPRGRFTLGPNQVSDRGSLVEVGAEDYTRWLAQHSTVRLTLDPRDRTTITPGSPLKWHLILETDALAPLALGSLRDASQFLSLEIDGAQVTLDPANAVVKSERLRLAASQPCVIECSIDPALFRRKGRTEVRAIFTRGTGDENVWTGSVKSPPILVEVK